MRRKEKIFIVVVVVVKHIAWLIVDMDLTISHLTLKYIAKEATENLL